MEGDYCVRVQDSTHTAEARRLAVQLASRLAFNETERGNVGLVVTEAAKNLLKHAGGGDLIVRPIEYNGSAAVEMLAVDKGPGIENIGRSFEDGYSTAGTPGTGLGAISRLSTLHDIYSQPGRGTVLVAQIWGRGAPQGDRWSDTGGFRIGGVSVPMPGEHVCGDAWSFFEHRKSAGRLTVADGLGHGPLAADAARTSIRIGEEYAAESGVGLMQRIHNALRPTRGAAVAVAEIDIGQSAIRYTGVGNIGATIVAHSGAVQHMVSHSGTAGHEAHRMMEFKYSWVSGSVLIMHSDGLISHWSMDRYPGLLHRHPSLIAGVLYRDFSRGRDDVTVVVVQQAGAVRQARDTQ